MRVTGGTTLLQGGSRDGAPIASARSWWPSGGRAGKLLALAVLMVTGGGTASAARVGPSSSTTDRLADKFAELDTAGIDTIFAGEVHDALYNRDLLASIVEGTRRQGPVVLYREVRVADVPTHRQNEAWCASATLKADRARCVTYWKDTIFTSMRGGPGADATREPELTRLGRALSANVTVRTFNFRDPKGEDLGDAIKDGSRMVIHSLGLFHATGELMPDKVNYHDRCTDIMGNLPADYRAPPLSPASQKDMFRGLERAQKTRQAALVVSSSSFDKLDAMRQKARPGSRSSRDLCERHLQEKGYAWVDLPLAHYNATATIFAPRKFQSVLKGAGTGQATPKPAPKPVQRDEL